MGLKQERFKMIEEGRLRVSVPVALRTGSLTLRLWAGERQLSLCAWASVPAGWLLITIEAEVMQAGVYARARVTVAVEVKSNEAVSVSIPEADFLRTILKAFPFLPLEVAAPKHDGS